MASDAVDEPSARPLLTLGRVDLVRVQVGYRAAPDGPVHQQFLLDLPIAEDENGRAALDEPRVLAALEPVLYGDDATPRHYSLHTHRSHTSWGPSPGALEIGLLVTAGSSSEATSGRWQPAVTRAFRELLGAAGHREPAPTSRETAVARARRSAAAAFAVDPGSLSLSAEQHHHAENSWAVGLRSTTGDEYDVLVGLVDGYPRSVRVRHSKRLEVFDSVGAE